MKSECEFPIHKSQEKSTLTMNSAIASGELCMACGLCCTGAIFSHVTISRNAYKRLPEANVSSTNNKIEMNFPCSFFQEGSCSVYHDRPHKCTSYNCKLVKQVISGETSLIEGKEIVDVSKKQANWLILNMPTLNYSNGDSLRSNLFIAHKLFNSRFKNTENPSFTTEEYEFCLNALDYVKGLAISFYTSSLLMKYNDLVMKMSSK
ncbi:protein containing UDF0153 [Sulfurimonas gotlandica GD1]|uniref:Protein containing UDF0153 n=1 Tax=Sulfurimonas gotlandica (strain DSM 19862 / JCM 16533 / GD1) TaxID=929558 RepID=B6BN87_SULGG|nr:YkgJ family cysteine cluster protein [Sulfurimonas gotlandica]EDZ61453.1 hypothetical protein CBGD1_2521 [Sulfurimonas gotlandica GD1]EHP30957.1 protein containing UDF0153 [Sulfurimonas gotlandica GD1]